jgi:hypothetical protein
LVVKSVDAPSRLKPIADVSKLAARELARAGFRKRSGDIFTREIEKEVLGWLGLNRAVTRQDGKLEINPVVGVRNQQIERLVADLMGSKSHPYIPPTISTHLGYLGPGARYTPWLFEQTDDLPADVSEMVEAVTTYGLPFMEKNKRLREMTSSLESGKFGPSHQTAYRLPVAYWLLGEKAQAVRTLDSKLAASTGRSDPGSQQYQKFAERLRKRIEQGEP